MDYCKILYTQSHTFLLITPRKFIQKVAGIFSSGSAVVSTQWNYCVRFTSCDTVIMGNVAYCA